MRHVLLAILASTPLAGAPLAAQTVDPGGRAILFIRGADGSGGATHGGSHQQRTEQLSDIFNRSTTNGNHGYNELRRVLLSDGFFVDQLIESSTPLSLATLLKYRVVVFGSNNKVHSAAEVATVHTYVDRGGSLLFISDANWGRTWEAAPASDNQFLDRYGAQVYQDSGHLPTMSRATSGRYLVADHAVLSGPDGLFGVDDIGHYNGEGVNLFRITKGRDGFQMTRMVSADGLNVRLNTTHGGAGATRRAGGNDAAMIWTEKGQSRIVGHFDRNTFFNRNGAGTDLHKLHNSALALNLFRYLASTPAISSPVGAGCGLAGRRPTLTITRPILGRPIGLSVTRATPNSPTWLVLAPGRSRPVGYPNSCTTFVDLANAFVLFPHGTNASGAWSRVAAVPNLHRLSGLRETLQVVVFATGGPFLGGAELTNGVEFVLGYPR